MDKHIIIIIRVSSIIAQYRAPSIFLYTSDYLIRKFRHSTKKVELDKARETSKTRKLSIATLTYFTMVSVMYSLDMDSPFIGAIIPTLGFYPIHILLRFHQKILDEILTTFFT